MLEARQIEYRVLRGVSLTIAPGEIVAVLGPNGAGKSTLLKVLSSEWKPASGDVLLSGQPLAAVPARERARSIAVLPQHTHLELAFTGLEVALLGRTPHPPGRHNQEIARAALGEVEAGHLADRRYPEMSGGEQQRVHLARVLAQIWEPACRPRYLLLDEPTANLDLSYQHRTFEVARRLSRESVGVLAIMHDLNLAAHHADRVLILREGRALAEGVPSAVLTADTIQQAFAYPVNVMPHPARSIPLIFPK